MEIHTIPGNAQLIFRDSLLSPPYSIHSLYLQVQYPIQIELTPLPLLRNPNDVLLIHDHIRQILASGRGFLDSKKILHIVTK